MKVIIKKVIFNTHYTMTAQQLLEFSKLINPLIIEVYFPKENCYTCIRKGKYGKYYYDVDVIAGEVELLVVDNV